MRRKCLLELECGDTFTGELVGAPLLASGELVFTTGMVGYSEALTDPSFFGQILVFSFPCIGNYGVPVLPDNADKILPHGFESEKVHVSAVVINMENTEAFHWSSVQSLHNWLVAQKVPGIVGLDTRHLVHLVRKNNGGLLAKVIPSDYEGVSAVNSSFNLDEKSFFDPSSQEIISRVSVRERKIIGSGKVRVAIVDCGVKYNIIRRIIQSGCEVELLPWDTDFKSVDSSAWVISNGPGDPSKTGDLVSRVRGLLGTGKPVLGICLGHQLLALAAGFNVTRMPYGHRSRNQPVYISGTRKGYITTQNHCYVVDAKSMYGSDWDVWFINANDQTVEGIKHKTLPIRSIQFHPEAAGGPRETGWILDEFVAGVNK